MMENRGLPRETDDQRAGCFGFLPACLSRNLKKKKTAACSAASQPRSSWPSATATTSLDEHYPPWRTADTQAMIESECESEAGPYAGHIERELLADGSIDTFAPWHIVRNSRLVLTPYFGKFAGQRMTFRVRRSESLVNIKVKVEGCDQTLTTLYYRKLHKRSEGSCSIRDRCVRYAHEVKANDDAVMRNPPKLSFLCKQTILVHLNDLPVSQLPPKYAQQFQFGGKARTVTVRVWPRNVCPTPLRMKVKMHISIGELQWMLCQRLSIADPTALQIYQANSLENLLPHNPIGCDQKELECVLLPSVFQNEIPVVVSVIGHGINHLRVSPTLTLCDFEQAVRQRFGMTRDNFLYFPQVFKSRKSNHCGLRMTAPLNDTTISLIDSMNRTLPIVDGMPSLQMGLNYKKLPLYKMTISDLGLLKSSPVIVFEVTGPTIPVAFKTIQGDWSNALAQQDSNFVLISYSMRPHALCVNPSWTIDTLLKYIECVSGLPCAHIHIGKVVLEPNDTVESHLTSRSWLRRTKHDKLALPNDIPEVSPL